MKLGYSGEKPVPQMGRVVDDVESFVVTPASFRGVSIVAQGVSTHSIGIGVDVVCIFTRFPALQ